MNHTDEQLQAAIDAAFQYGSHLPSLCVKNVTNEDWKREGLARLAIARAFLAELGKIKPADDPAWIPHDGGPCPLKDEEVAGWAVKLRSRQTLISFTRKPSIACWLHTGTGSDIIAYRVLKWKPGCDPEAKAANLKAFNEFQDEIHATWENADKEPEVTPDGWTPEMKQKLDEAMKHPGAADVIAFHSQAPFQAQPWQPAPGDVVRLKSGGPEMTVSGIGGDAAFCAWTNSDKRLELEPITIICLEPANKKHDGYEQ